MGFPQRFAVCALLSVGVILLALLPAVVVSQEAVVEGAQLPVHQVLTCQDALNCTECFAVGLSHGCGWCGSHNNNGTCYPCRNDSSAFNCHAPATCDHKNWSSGICPDSADTLAMSLTVLILIVVFSSLGGCCCLILAGCVIVYCVCFAGVVAASHSSSGGHQGYVVQHNPQAKGSYHSHHYHYEALKQDKHGPINHDLVTV